MCGMPPPVFAGGDIQFGLWLCYLGQQWPPEQHLAPQQSARCDVAVAVPIVARAIIIIKRYFIKFLPVPAFADRRRSGNSITSRSLAQASRREPWARGAAGEQADDRIATMKWRSR
jgi:hypothetical protein